MALNDAVRTWCDANLAFGKAYGSSPDGTPIACVSQPIESQPERTGKLVYQDGTDCSAGYMFNDVYVLDDGSYTIYSDVGNTHNGAIRVEHCPTLSGVVDYLCDHHITSCYGLFNFTLIPNKACWEGEEGIVTRLRHGKTTVPHLSMCNGCPALAALIAVDYRPYHQ